MPSDPAAPGMTATEPHWMDRPLTYRGVLCIIIGAVLGNLLWKIVARLGGLT